MQIILLKSREKDGYETSLPVCCYLLQIERSDGNTIAILIYTFSFLFTSFSMNGKESKLKKLQGI